MRNIISVLVIIISTTLILTAKSGAEPPLEWFTKLRMDYAARSDFDPMWDVASKERQAIIEAYRQKKREDMVKLSQEWLTRYPVDAEIHYLYGQTLYDLGHYHEAQKSLMMFFGLLSSISSSGDGRSQETAIKVISVGEEYYFLNNIGAKLKQQTKVDHYDKMECELANGEQITFWFDVTIPINVLNKLFDLNK